MIYKKYTIFLLLFFLTITEIKSEIANCLFVNTVNLTNMNETFVSTFNHSLTADYDYIVLRNGTKVSVPLHKRGCICANPCLSLCTEDAKSWYYDEEDDYTLGYQREITFEDESKMEDYVEFFNHRIYNLKCNGSYPLVMELNDNDAWSIFENGTLLIRYTNEYRDQEEYCFNFYEVEDIGGVILPFVCPIVNDRTPIDIVKNVAMACSVPFYLITIFFYCFFTELRNCHGKCFIMYLLYLTITYSLICYNTLSYVQLGFYECITIGEFLYLFRL
ncbi:putative G-protein coupled receptor Mth-like 4 [Lucilia cuprina]|nr:putative G-protein coupled receptor Mth-like 4 [Lucilia cuprina]